MFKPILTVLLSLTLCSPLAMAVLDFRLDLSQVTRNIAPGDTADFTVSSSAGGLSFAFPNGISPVTNSPPDRLVKLNYSQITKTIDPDDPATGNNKVATVPSSNLKTTLSGLRDRDDQAFIPSQTEADRLYYYAFRQTDIEDRHPAGSRTATVNYSINFLYPNIEQPYWRKIKDIKLIVSQKTENPSMPTRVYTFSAYFDTYRANSAALDKMRNTPIKSIEFSASNTPIVTPTRSIMMSQLLVTTNQTFVTVPSNGSRSAGLSVIDRKLGTGGLLNLSSVGRGSVFASRIPVRIRCRAAVFFDNYRGKLFNQRLEPLNGNGDYFEPSFFENPAHVPTDPYSDTNRTFWTAIASEYFPDLGWRYVQDKNDIGYDSNYAQFYWDRFGETYPSFFNGASGHIDVPIDIALGIDRKLFSGSFGGALVLEVSAQ